MGYRSEVRVMTTPEGFKKMQNIAWKLAEEKNVNDDMVLFSKHGQDPDERFDYYDAQADYLCFGFDWVKWYDTYKDVSLFMETLEIANQNGIAWQFIRIGEEFEDVETMASDSFYDNPTTVMNVSIEITY